MWPWEFMANPAKVEAETSLKVAMPWPWQAADPTKLGPAIEMAKKAGVPAKIISAAEEKLRGAIEKAEADAVKEAENQPRLEGRQRRMTALRRSARAVGAVYMLSSYSTQSAWSSQGPDSTQSSSV